MQRLIPFDPDKELTPSQIVYYLFGNPLDPRDLGIIGRMEQRVDRVTRLAWAILLLLLTAMLTLLADIINTGIANHRFP